jgi:hypothetical protein
MTKHTVAKSVDGFGFIQVIIVVLVVCVIGGAGWFVFQSNRTKPGSATSNDIPVGNGTTLPLAEPQPTVGYLEIKELGVRLKLVDVTSDAYYTLSTKASRTGKPNVFLSTQSLDKYEGCNANETSRGVAILSTFVEGYSDEVTGDYSKAYPDAPKIGNLYYYVQGNQYDCTKEKDTELYSSVRHALIDSYTTVESIPDGQQ